MKEVTCLVLVCYITNTVGKFRGQKFKEVFENTQGLDVSGGQGQMFAHIFLFASKCAYFYHLECCIFIGT